MKRKKRISLMLSLLFGGFTISTLSSCGEVSNGLYTLDLNFDSTLGTVSSETLEGNAGDNVTIKITPNEGVVVDSVKVNGVEAKLGDNGILTFTTIGGKNTVDVVFKDPTVQPPTDKSFSVKTEFDSKQGTVILDKTSGTDYSQSTSAVKVSIIPNNGFVVETIIVNGESKDKSFTEFSFQPKPGENIVKVTFAKKEGPVDDAPTYYFKITYNEEGGIVGGTNTAGEISEGLKVKFTVTPNEGYLVSSVIFNSMALAINSSGIYEVTPVLGENTFNVVFKLKEVEPPLDTFSISVNVVNKDGGTYNLSKTSGISGETVSLHVEPNDGYETQIIFNQEEIFLDENFNIELKPLNGTNQLDIIFAKSSSGEDSIDDGFEINFDESDLLGSPDFDKTYFANNFFNRIYDLFAFSSSSKEANINQFYDSTVSKLNITKNDLELLNKVIDETDAINRLKEGMLLNLQGLNEEAFKRIFSLLVDVKEELTSDLFSYFSLFFFLSADNWLNSSVYSNNYGGLLPADFDDAIAYFEANNDHQTADEIRNFDQSISQDNVSFNEILINNNKVSILLSRFLYPMIDSLLEIENNKEELASLLYQSINFFKRLITGIDVNELFISNNSSQNLNILQFTGKVLYRAMPNIDSFETLTKKTELFTDFVKFLEKIGGFPGDYSFDASYDEVLKKVSEDSDSLYYIVKFIGKCLENITEEDYFALKRLIIAFFDDSWYGNSTYEAAIQISKLIVSSLKDLEFVEGTFNEYLINGFTLIGELIATLNRVSVIRLESTYSDSSDPDLFFISTVAHFNVVISNSNNIFGNLNAGKILEYISTIAQYQASNIGSTEINYILSFLNYFNNETSDFYSDENRYTYSVEYVENPFLNEDLNINVNQISFNGDIGLDVGKSSGTASRIRGAFTIKFGDYCKITFPYIVGCISTYYGELGQMVSYINGSLYGTNEFFVQKDYEFNEDDSLCYANFSDNLLYSILSFENYLDTSTLGWHYRKVEIENRYYFLKYYVYLESELLHEYLIYGEDIYQNKYIKIDSVFGSDYLMFDNKKYIVHEQTYKLNSSVILDTSKAGNNKVNLMLKSGDMVEVSYYVCEVKSFEEILVCDNYQPEYEYQNLKIDDDKIYYFRCEQHVVYINGLGVEKKISKDVWMKELTKNDFENKLDNSEAGIHTDYLTIEGKRYEFSYNVKARLDSSDTEFHYYIEEPYLLGSINGFLIENPIRVVKAKRLQFCDEENGIETIAEYADEEEKYFDPDKNDFTQIELGEDGTFSDIYVILTDGSKITARVYFSDCTIIDTTYEIHSLNYILKDNLPDDNYSLEVIEFSEILMSSWLVNDCSLIYETSRFDIPFYQIKESLNLSSNGTSMELYGHECRIYYNVVESLEVKFGYYQELYSGIKDVYALHMPNLNNQDFVVVKAKNARLGSLDYLNDGTISCDVYDDGEYKYYIFDTSEIEELWLYVDNHDLGGTFEIMDSSRINTIIDESSLIVSGFPYFENGSYTLNFYYTELIQADGTTVSKKTKTLTINYTVDELKEMYAQSGNGDYVNLKVEIGGEIHFVKINASWFSELS